MIKTSYTVTKMVFENDYLTVELTANTTPIEGPAGMEASGKIFFTFTSFEDLPPELQYGSTIFLTVGEEEEEEPEEPTV